MTQENKHIIQNIIESQINLFQNELEKLRSNLTPLQKDCCLDDVAYETLIQEQNIFRKRHEDISRELLLYKNTLPRVHTDSYGICTECDDEIAIARLKLVPYSKICMECMQNIS